MVCFVVFFFKQKTAYEMRISDWSSDVCSSDLRRRTKRSGEARSAWLAPRTCAALHAWLKRAEIAAGPVFRRVHSDGRLGEPLLGQAIARRFKSLAAAAGLEATRVSGHSTRIGMCVDHVAEDRKGVVSGKRGSVRVDLGGRGLIKKKK